MTKYISVKINSYGRIPFSGGYGPFGRPVRMTPAEFNALTRMGFNVEIVNPLKVPEATDPDDEYDDIPEVEEPEVEPEPEEEPEVEPEEEDEEPEEEPEVEEEPELEDESNEDETDYILTDDEELSANAYYTYDFLTKDKAITILENREVEHNPNDNADPLKQLVIDTNPEVDFE